MKKSLSVFVAITLIIGIGLAVAGKSRSESESADTKIAQNVEVRDGVQYVTIYAKGGYTPRVSNANANIATKIVVKTNGTYDCSSALVIRSIGYQKILPPSGEEVIDVGTPRAGLLQGICSMGMYHFVVKFQ